MIWLKILDSLGNQQSPLQKRRLFLGRQSGSSKGQFTLLWSLSGVPKIYFNEGDNSGWHSFRKLFFCAHGSRPAWLPTSLFGKVEGCKEPDQHQLVYGVSAIKGRKVVEKMCLQPGLTHSVRLSGSSLLNLWRLLSPRGHPHKGSCFLIRPPLDLTFTGKSQI